VLNIFVSKISLQGSRVVTPVCQRIAAGVPEHMSYARKLVTA